MFEIDKLLRINKKKHTNNYAPVYPILISIIFLFNGIFVYHYLCLEQDYWHTQSAYAEGLTQENLPPASLGDREGSLFIKISPPIYTTETKEDAFMQFRLFDANTNETIEFVTYDITVTKGANPSDEEEPLLRDFFQSPSGLLTIRVEPTNDSSLTIYGNRDPFLGAWGS